MGWIASTYGVPASFAVAGIGCLVTGALALPWLARIQARRGVRLAAPASLSRSSIEAAPGGALPARPR